jgi:hypothetical protein
MGLSAPGTLSCRTGRGLHSRRGHPSFIISLFIGVVAQLGERRVRNAEVEGSIPFHSTNTPLGRIQRRPFRRRFLFDGFVVPARLAGATAIR